MKPIPTPDQLTDAAANVFDSIVRGGLADLRRTPAAIIEEAPQCTVYRYLVADEAACRALPVLLVPPLAAPTLCFDLRRGCSLAEHLLALGHPTYLVEYGEIGYADRDLGLEHWVEDVIPTAIRRVCEDSGGAPVQLVGWCLGGIMSLLALAGDNSLAINSIAMVASPFDFARARLLAPMRPVANVTNGLVLSVAGATDTLAPRPAVHAVGDLLPNAAEVRLETGPGGHLGVLTGRSAKRTTWVYIDEFFGRHGSPAHRAGEPARRHLRVVA